MNPAAFLLKAAEQQRMNHAYLLSGNAKEQKLKVLRELMRRLLSEDKDSKVDIHQDLLWVKESPAIARVQEIKAASHKCACDRGSICLSP